ncbi:hypothetical protein M2651_11570 [Clostridium sp. SYSU_GA19001]|uniref:hypothetical protein n=1 Tax=Clostridium caldaquaticum TaxID=2940653 RepID=UPI002076E546|nr:hypothetical protein [Clostridium caldaquaticum]MCM8711654.1 hypothetical protein [Clostridium caldaquaticum]
MLKKIIFYDLIIAVTAGITIQLIWDNYSNIFILGLFTAVINFAFSKFMIENILGSKFKRNRGLVFFITFVRIFIICIIGVSIFNNNIKNIISFIMGFTSHFLALILYGVINLANERK